MADMHLLNSLANVALERLRYPGFGVRIRVVSSCFTDVCIIPSYFFCFLAIDNDIMRKMRTLITSKGTDIDENIANQNHATRTRTPKPGYLNLSIVDAIASLLLAHSRTRNRKFLYTMIKLKDTNLKIQSRKYKHSISKI